MALLDNTTLYTALGRPTLEGTLAEAVPGYYQTVIDSVHAEIASYLDYDPVLAVHTDEEGTAQLVTSGPYQGRYVLRLRHRPLVGLTAASVFTTLQLTYALAATVPTDVSLQFAQVDHHTGQVFCLAPGSVDALSPAFFGYAPGLAPLTGVGYRATYVAGYATGVDDPVQGDSTPYPALPLPADIRAAAVLLVRDRIAGDAALNVDGAAASAPYVSALRFDEWQITYTPPKTATPRPALGYGTPLGQQAARLLAPYRALRTITLL